MHLSVSSNTCMFSLTGTMKCLIFTSIAIVASFLGANVDGFFFTETSFIQVTNATIPLKQGFDLTFRTCRGGVLLYQAGNGDDYVLLLVSPGAVNYNISISPPHFNLSDLALQWKVNGVEGSVHAGNELDKNYIHTVTFDPGSSSVNATIKIDGPNRYSAEVPKEILDFTRSGPMYVGGNLSNTSLIKGFIGCIDSGRNIPLVMSQRTTNVQAGCPLDSQAGCTRKKCNPGFTGYYCEVNIDECNGNPCHSFSTCVDGINSFTCICGPQWTGQKCDTFLGSPCDAKPCKNGGVCKESFDRNNYTCTCPAGWTGRNCDSSFNPCDLSPCLNNGTCCRNSNTSNGLNCTCQKGFTGIRCETNINDCASLPCANGKCIDGIDSFTCNCTGSGYTGLTCSEDINECASSPCLNNATCHNYIGTYDCRCVRGFDGKHCENNTDDCSSRPRINGGTCNPNQVYIDQINNYTGVCKPGFTGSNCAVDIKECQSNPCYNNGTCNEGVNGYNCSCLPRFNGTHCELDTINDCSSQPCLNNGTCVDGVADFDCNCTRGFYGKRCELDVFYPNPCENNGTCTLSVITVDYTGKGCSILFNPCNAYECKCKEGYYRRMCEHHATEWCHVGKLCRHGNCSGNSTSFYCSCFPGWEGVTCDDDIKECERYRPCKHNGTCIDSNTANQKVFPGYYCKCTKEYTGKNCQEIYQVPPTNEHDSAVHIHFAWILPPMVIIAILLVIVVKQRRNIAVSKKYILPSESRVFPPLDSEPGEVSRNEEIPLESATLPSSTPANDDYEPVDQIITEQRQHQLLHLSNNTQTTATTTYNDNQHPQCNSRHISTSATAELIGIRNRLSSYYNTAHDPEDDTTTQQSSDKADASAYPGVFPAATHYQELVYPEPRTSEGFYQQLCPATRKEDEIHEPGKYASLEVSAVREYQGLDRSVRVDMNDMVDYCS